MDTIIDKEIEKAEKKVLLKERYKLFKKEVLEFAKGDKDKAELAEKLSDLRRDYEYLKELNTWLSLRYNDVMICTPTSKEIQNLINEYVDSIKTMDSDIVNEPKETLKISNKKLTDELKTRITFLTKYKSCVVNWEKDNERKIPPEYKFDEKILEVKKDE